MKKSKARRIGERLEKAIAVLERGERLEKHFRVDTISIPDPPRYLADDVKRIRAKLGVTQRMFALIVGVSSELIEHWEQGVRLPRAMACKLLEAIEREPDRYFKRTVAGPGVKARARKAA